MSDDEYITRLKAFMEERGITPAESLDEEPFDYVSHWGGQLERALFGDEKRGKWWEFRHATRDACTNCICHNSPYTWATDLVNNEPRRTLLMAGPTGVGKTWHAISTLRFLSQLIAEKEKRRVDWEIVSHMDLMAQTIDQREPVDRWAEVEVLILDDFGAPIEMSEAGEIRTPAWRVAAVTEKTFNIVDRRNSQQLTTIYTTNLGTKDTISAAMGDRIASRVLNIHNTRRLAMLGPDRRFAR